MDVIWKHSPTLDVLNALSEGTSVAHLGILFTEVGPNYLKAEMPVDHRTIQPFGILHGGASAHLAETLGSVASSLCVDDPMINRPVGLEISATHLKSVASGQKVIGVATPLKIGNRLHVWQINIMDESGAIICYSKLSVMILNSST
jgi:1,4-dihydroxy-2-naphthoyl-CoA hydrolase